MVAGAQALEPSFQAHQWWHNALCHNICPKEGPFLLIFGSMCYMCRGDLKWHKKLRHTTFSMRTLLKMLHSLPFQDIQPWEQGCILFGITGLNFPSTYGCNNLNEAEFPSFLDLKQLGCCVLCFPKCFQRRQPEGEEVVLIKSSLCFPGTGAFADVCC